GIAEELCRKSPEFLAMWRDNDVRRHGEGAKHIKNPILGPIAFEYSAFQVDGRPDLRMVVYNPATAEDAAKIRELVG
ncbi:transcriptional regulator, partial [Rhizobium ruizarguesonis]